MSLCIANAHTGFQCAEGLLLVGYESYQCDTTTGELGARVIDDDVLTVYSECVAADSDVCTDVNIVSSKTRVSSALYIVHVTHNNNYHV